MPLQEDQIVKIKLYDLHQKDWETKLKSTKNKPDIPVLSMPKFSDFLWLKKQEMVVLGARSSHGKSSFAMQLAVDALDSGLSVAFVSLEMTSHECLSRMFCHVCRVPNEHVFKCNPYTKLEFTSKIESYRKYVDNVKHRFFFTDHIGRDFDEVNDYVCNVLDGIDLVIVDYVQSIRADGNSQERQRLNEYIRKFRELAIRKDFCGVLVSQINRGAEKGTTSRPCMSQLKGTGVLEEHADKVLLVYYPAKDGKDAPYQIIVAKNKNGDTGTIEVEYIPGEYRFRELQEFHAPPPVRDYNDPEPYVIEKARDLFGAVELKNFKKPAF